MGYPRAALLGFDVALSTSNILSTVQAAMRSTFGVEKIEAEVSRQPCGVPRIVGRRASNTGVFFRLRSWPRRLRWFCKARLVFELELRSGDDSGDVGIHTRVGLGSRLVFMALLVALDFLRALLLLASELFLTLRRSRIRHDDLRPRQVSTQLGGCARGKLHPRVGDFDPKSVIF